jgi:ABC-type lipoprotein release transport system permease subunit
VKGGSRVLELKLAYRNLKGAGLRTVLNVIVLSVAYVLIIWHQGMFSGMLRQASRDMIKDEVAGGQYWHKNYDPYDFVSLDDARGKIAPDLQLLISKKQATPILIRQASIYPEGRAQSVLLKGIDPEQTILRIPSDRLLTEDDVLPILIGQRMAKNNSLEIGDYLTIRLRDARGTFDAVEGKIAEIMVTNVPTIDSRQLWIPLERMQEIMCTQNEATMVVVREGVSGQKDVSDWRFKERDFLLKDLIETVKMKRASSIILYAILLFLAMLAVFDAQILSIFRRRKEIGMLIALGMTRLRVVKLFTIEGALNGILAAAMGAVYGIPLLLISAKKGIPMPEVTDSMGYAISSSLYPFYSARLVLGTVIIVMLTVIIVSYLPSSKISKLKPTEALKGKTS